MAADEPLKLGTLLSRYRAALGVTQEELAERAGLSVRGIRDLETGIISRPRAYTVRQLVEALELTPDDRALFERAARTTDTATPIQAGLPVGNYLGALPASDLVARAEELERIRSVLDSVAGGAGQLLLLSGELGVGKTRLLQALMVEAREQGYFVLIGRCYSSEQSGPFYPFLEALTVSDTVLPAGIRSDWQRAWKRAKSLLAVNLADTESEPAAAVSPSEVSGAVSDLLVLATQSMPVALLLDDVHSADAESLKLLQHLAHSVRNVPILLAAAFCDARITEEHSGLAAALQTLGRERLAERITVRRFSQDETTELVAATMGEQQTVSEEFASFVHRRTKGNPRLIDQLVRSLGGRLELQGEIGAGAMGRVFRAYDQTLEQSVAAKLVLARSEIDLDALLRFQQEGAVLARLDHPHIVDIYDTFAEEHASCIIMELLEGQSLGQLLQDGPLPLPRAKAMALQVADALSYAHSQDIVHRDIKPDNVMVLDHDQVKVTDFGIARILQPDTSLGTIATTGMRMGTPLYMAPEQLEGKKVDGRTDIYALGAMLYHLVTGRPPFEGNDALAVAVKHLQEEPVRPSQINPTVPADWDALILRAMAKDPAKRFQSAQEMQAAIGALGEVTAPQTVSLRRRWRLAGAAGVIALAAAILAGLWAHGAQSRQRPGPVASIDAYLAQHHFSGYILLERHGHVLLSKGYGMADTKAHVPNAIRSRWPAVGAGKIMTAIAILRLQDQRGLSVHDRVCRYLRDCPSAWRSITIHQLLLDTSGLGSFDVSPAPRGMTQALAQCKALPVGVPGASTPESSCDDLLLNTIIIKAAGKPWLAAMHQLVFGPAHMVDTGQLTNAANPPGLVQGYRAGVPVQLGSTSHYYLPYSSVRDLEWMDRALLSGHLLSQDALHALFTSYIRGGAVLSRYFSTEGSNATRLAGGYEWYLRQATRTTVTVADKPGILGAISLDNAVSPEDGTIAIMAKNDDSGADPTDLFFGLASHLLWERQTSAPSPSSNLANKLAAYLTRGRFNGYVYLERRGHVILSKGFGMADAEDKVPNTARTTWPAFEENRFLVGLAIMKLQERGTLSVQDRICRYIGGCPAAWQPITIRELLTNTSGIGSHDPFAPGATLDKTMVACKATPLVAPSGPQLHNGDPWSDCNTFLLGVILETVTGKTWEAAMHDLVFGPAGMTHSGRMTNALKPPQRGRLYRAGVPTRELNYDGYNLAYTTAEDVIRLNHALLAGTLLSQRSLAIMFTPLFHDDPSDSTSPWRGYEVVISPATATAYKAVCEACAAGGGEDEEGIQAGFFMDIWVSPEAGALQITINNDSGYYEPGAINDFDRLVYKPLYGKYAETVDGF